MHSMIPRRPELKVTRADLQNKIGNGRLGGWAVGRCIVHFGYTLGMKTAISIADEVFHKAERYARRNKKSRSEIYSAAMAEYLARHDVDAVTEAMNKALEEVGEQVDEFVNAASRRMLKRTQW